GLLEQLWATSFARLSDASRDAARAISPLGWQARYQALQDMLAHVHRASPEGTFQELPLGQRLSHVIECWRLAALQALESLKTDYEGMPRIDNPYKPGPTLELRDSLFVGRRDLIQQLEDALGKGAGRPTFLLTGERRMGKSSTLRQLPYL